MSIYALIKKHISLRLAGSLWEKKAICIEADHPDFASFVGNSLLFHKHGLEIKFGEYEFLLDGFDYFKQLSEYGGFLFSFENGVIVAKDKKFSAEIHTAEELFILREVYLSRDYNFQSFGNVVVIDIGMNVGLASLYFASRDDVKYVYAFEPFKPTYQQCMKNLERNPVFSRKITANNFGLAYGEQSLEVDYDFDHKGQAGIHGKEMIKSRLGSVHKEQIKLVAIFPEIQEIIERHSGIDLVCKMDCEGGEYDIFRSFSEYGIPEAIKIIMMEWHEKGPDEILDVLKNNNFRAVATYTYRQDVGMIYAFRS